MLIEIDGIPLIFHNQPGGPEDIRTVTNISTGDSRAVVEHEIPGMEGNSFQDVGRSPVTISFDGSLHGPAARGNVEKLRSKFKQGTPLPFLSDISGATDVTKVLIEDLRVMEEAGIPEVYNFSIILQEYKEPPPEPVTPPSQDDDAKQWMGDQTKKAQESNNFLSGIVKDPEGKPKEGIPVIASGHGITFESKSNANGVYRIDNLLPGKYLVSVGHSEYSSDTNDIVIGSAEASEDSGDSSDETPEDEEYSEDSDESSDETPEDEETSEDSDESSDETPEDEEASEDSDESSDETPEDEEASEDSGDSSDETPEDEEYSEDTDESPDETPEDEEYSEDTDESSDETPEDEEASEDSDESSDESPEDEEYSEDTDDWEDSGKHGKK